jgi:replication initiation protein RepC
MEHIMSSPVPRHVRRTNNHHQKDPLAETPKRADDARWSLLDLVRSSRKHLGLRDRDIAVLRGLLSLVPPSAAPDTLVVFASNRVLIERCDGIDERTLRRRLEHLKTCGFIARRSSPNGKRYQVRDDSADVRLTYGIDISPLFAIRNHLTALAEQCLRNEIRTKALRSVIRDILYHYAPSIQPELAEHASRSIRRSLSCDQLEEIVKQLQAEIPTTSTGDAIVTSVLTVRDSQNDRHIQSSEKENYESEPAWEKRSPEIPAATTSNSGNENSNDITVAECMALAKNAAAFAMAPAQDWNDVVRLSDTLAPAIGLEKHDIENARRTMGSLGSALAILGLVEAFEKIRRPRAYLSALSKHASEEGFNFVRMFRSLTKCRATGPSARYAAGCIPR